MNVEMAPRIRLIVDSEEFRLISRALRGQLTEEETPKALALQEKMLRDRAAQAELYAREARKNADNIERAKEGKGNV